MALEQSKRFDDLDKKTQNILVALLDSHDAHIYDLKLQTIAVAQMLNRTEVILTDQHDQTRALITDAMQVANGMRDGLGTPAQRENAEKIQKDEEHIKESVENRILDWLYFKEMSDRQDEIEEAHLNTLEWMFCPDTPQSKLPKGSNFINWLETGHGTYWINGKAGSGKSTLMRYICESEETKRRLLVWAGDIPLTICQFFFWNSGTIEQRSQAGLLRCLLYDILKQHGHLIPIALPSTWARTYSNSISPSLHQKADLLSQTRLVQALKALVKQQAFPLKLCLFIDGLDEFEGDPGEMADLFTEIVASKNIKICLSSRPLVAFDIFKASSTIRLQDLSFQDIKLFVADKLHMHKRFQQLALREDQSALALALVQDIVKKADGVFLWVKLVVRSILIGLRNRDEIVDLQRRLQELPSDLEALFDDMLMRRIEPFYQAKASRLFQVVRASREQNDQLERFGELPAPLTLLALSFADDNDSNLAMDSAIRPLTDLQSTIRCDTMEDKLKTACAGLLEVQGGTDSELDVAADGSVDASVLENAKADGKVQYLHRTVKDYLEQPSVWKTITARTTGTDFDPHLQLLKSCLLQLKTSHFQMAFIPEDIWTTVSLALEYARRAELKGRAEYIPLLDQVDFVITWILQQMQQTYLGHWARHYLAGDERPLEWVDTTTAIAVEYGLCAYLDYKFRQSDSNPLEKPGRPLLDYAMSQTPRRQRYLICAPVVDVLLSHGADPNQRYNSMSPWENAISFAYGLQFPATEWGTTDWGLFGNERIKPDRGEVMELLCIFMHFVEYGADLNGSCIVKAGYEKPNERQPVLFIVKDVFGRWYPKESAQLVSLLENRGASEDLVSDFTIYRALAWSTVKRVRLRLW